MVERPREQAVSPDKKQEIPLPEFIIGRLADEGVEHVFGMTGGAIANVFWRFKGREDIKPVFCQHEQAAAMAAEAYARLHESGLGVAFATSGPGGTNLITGMYGAWFDSIPTLFLTGQVSRVDLMGETGVRQLGFQEADMVAEMRPHTKMSEMVTRPEDIKVVLERAIHVAREGRPGPVHLDLPMDLQLLRIDPESLPGFVPKEKETDSAKLEAKVERVIEAMAKAERPLLVAGAGIRLSGAMNEFNQLVKELDWPVLPSWAFVDSLPDDHPNKVGLFGVYGNLGANLAVQNADFLLVIGTRLDTRMAGSKPEMFAREAKIVWVDVDPTELRKGTVKPDLPIEADAGEFIEALIKKTRSQQGEPWFRQEKERGINTKGWKQKCREWKTKYPIVIKEHFEGEIINPYALARVLSDLHNEGDVIIPDCGGNLTWIMQSWQIKSGQRLFSSFGNSPMGYAFPAAIGASLAIGRKPVTCIIGDGGMQINIQELQTVVNYEVPVKIIVVNNLGYGIIRNFQDLYLGGDHIGSRESCPDFVKVAKAYGLPAIRITKPEELKGKLGEVLKHEGPILCDVTCDPDADLCPRTRFGRPIEEIMTRPPVNEEDLAKEMIVERWPK